MCDDLTSGEFAAALSIGRRTAATWCAEGRIGCYRTPGGRWRIPATEVDRIKSERSEMLTATQAAERLGTVPVTVMRWARAGKLNAVRQGRRWVIPAAAIDAMREDA